MEPDHRLQLEDEYYEINRNFLILSQLFLSAPVGIERPRQAIKQKHRWLHHLQVIWCLTIYSLLAFCIYDEYTMWNIDLPTIQKPLYFSEYLIYLIHLLEFIRLINFCGEMFWSFQIFILDFDGTLSAMKLHIHYNDLRQFQALHMFFILLHLLTCVVTGYFYNNCEILNFLRTNTIYILPNVVTHFSLLQYYALLFFIYKRGDKLYSVLEELLNASAFRDKGNLRRQFSSIRSLFAKLDEFTKNINDHFSISICLVYLGSFINLSVNLFLLYKYFNTWHQSNAAWIVYSLAWTCMHIVKMFLILYYNQKVQNMKIKATILLSSFSFEHQETEITQRLFILQLMSDTRSNYVCGLVALNMNFIPSLLMATSTLFIFLVQYDITYEALTSNHAFNKTNHYKED